MGGYQGVPPHCPLFSCWLVRIRRGFGNFEAAARFCLADDEQRDYFRTRPKPKEKVSLAHQRRIFRQRFTALQEAWIAA